MTQIKYKTPNIDENQTRIHAALVVLLMSAYLLSGNSLIMYILVYDFFVRIYVTPLLSPLYLLSANIVSLIGLKQKLVDASAKEFASHVGLTILFIAICTELLNYTSIAFTLVLFLTAWKLFEATKDVCFACKFYEQLKRKNIEVISL